MFASQNRETPKARAGVLPPARSRTPKRLAFNPLWHRLASHVPAPTVQTKLEAGAPDDAYEREADQVADRVTRMPAPGIRRKCTECEEEEKETVALRAESGAAGTAPIVSAHTGAQIAGLRGGGNRITVGAGATGRLVRRVT